MAEQLLDNLRYELSCLAENGRQWLAVKSAIDEIERLTAVRDTLQRSEHIRALEAVEHVERIKWMRAALERAHAKLGLCLHNGFTRHDLSVFLAQEKAALWVKEYANTTTVDSGTGAEVNGCNTK